MPRKQAPRSEGQRSIDNALYAERRGEAGIVRLLVMIPAERVAELRAIAMAWRAEAKLMLETDYPSADQILQIHAVSRALGIPLEVEAFQTRGTAAAWLAEHGRGLKYVQLPYPRVQPE